MISPGNILIVQIGKLGDMILTTPLLREIKKNFPESRLTVLASERNYEIAEADVNTDEVIIFPVNAFKKAGFFLKLKLMKFDLWIDTKNEFSKTSSILVKTAKPSRSLGFNFEEPVFSTSLSKYAQGAHAVDINLSAVYCLKPGVKPNRIPELNIDSSYYKDIEKYTEADGKKILFNISAGNKIRHWETQKWIELSLKLHDHFQNRNEDYRIYIISDSTDANDAMEIALNAAGVNITSLNLGLFEKLALISKMDALVSPDTSMVHAASAFNIPAACLYTNVEWNIRKFSPLSPKNKVLTSDNENSINSISEDEVFEAVKELL